MSLFTHLFIHASLSILIGFLVSLYFGSTLILISVALLMGFLIDVDHLIDYFLSFKKFNLKRFLKSQQFVVSGRVIKLFHAWELVFVLIVIALFFSHNLLIQAILISAGFSLFIHLLSDCLINREPIIFYFFLYRYKKNFLIDDLDSENVILEKD